MATITIRPPVAQYVEGGGDPLILPFKADSGATWAFGDVLEFDKSTGKVNPADAGDAILLGIALGPCPLATRTDITDYLVLVFTPDLVFNINVWIDNTASGNDVCAQTNIGNLFDFAISGSPNAVCGVLDIGSTTDTIIKIVGPSEEIGGGVFGDYYQRVACKLLPAACAWQV